MLLHLYNLFEKIIYHLLESFRDFDRQNLTLWKTICLLISTIWAGYGIWYSMRSITHNLLVLVGGLFNSKVNVLGLWTVINVLMSFMSEIKFSLMLLIAVVGLYSLFVSIYINNVNGNVYNIIHAGFQDIFERDDDFDDNFDDDLEANLDKTDNQNVHNSTVNRHVVESLKLLQTKEKQNQVEKLGLSSIYGEIRAYLLPSLHANSSLAMDVLDQMYNFNHFHTPSGLNEMEILRLIWQRINHPINSLHQSDLKEALLVQLADCKPNDVMMCLTGRVSRILQSLETIDAENVVDLKPLWAIKDEIGTIFGRYVDKLLNRVDHVYRDAYEALDRTERQCQHVKEFQVCLKRNLDRKFKLKYLDTNILNQTQLNELSQPFYDEISV